MRFPDGLTDEDGWLSTPLDEPAPVFVHGLHRSGTTWLYALLSKRFGLAPVTVWHVFFYPRLLARGVTDRALLDGHFAKLGLKDRQIDGIALSHATVEEVGWLLQKHGGSPRIDDRTDRLFRNLDRKLRTLSPGVPGTVYKNPWEVGRAAKLSARFSAAKFVFIRRDPVRLLQSQLRNALLFAQDAVYLDLLLDGFARGRAAMGAQRSLLRFAGEAAYTRVMLAVLTRDIAHNLVAYQRDLAATPAHRRVEVAYADLVEQPGEVLQRVGEFLQLPDLQPHVQAVPTPRNIAIPTRLESHFAAFASDLDRRGLGVPARERGL